MVRMLSSVQSKTLVLWSTPALSRDFLRPGCPYAKDVSQTDDAALITREVYTCNSCHNFLLLSLALTLLELGGFLINDVHFAFTTDDLTIDGTLFDGGSNLHN